jgi:hypothetical protein
MSVGRPERIWEVSTKIKLSEVGFETEWDGLVLDIFLVHGW